MLPPTPPHNIILFELDFDVKFPLLGLLLFLSDLKSTIVYIALDKFSSFSFWKDACYKKN
jgi:hypothetical protein